MYWETLIRLQIRNKFGAYGSYFEPNLNHRTGLDEASVAARVLQLIGVRFAEPIDWAAAEPVAFGQRFECVVRVKSLLADEALEPYLATLPPPTDISVARELVALLEREELRHPYLLCAQVALARLCDPVEASR